MKGDTSIALYPLIPSVSEKAEMKYFPHSIKNVFTVSICTLKVLMLKIL